MLEKTIHDFHQKTYSREEVIAEIKNYSRLGYDIYIGTDSQAIQDKFYMATCICFRHQTLGCGKIFYVRSKEKKEEFPTLRSRMAMEVYRSIEMAAEISDYVSTKIIIHIDIGRDSKKSKTAGFGKEFRAMVQGQGFELEIKNDAWAASSVADRLCK